MEGAMSEPIREKAPVTESAWHESVGGVSDLYYIDSIGNIAATVDGHGWTAWAPPSGDTPVAWGDETGDAGKALAIVAVHRHAARSRLIAAAYRWAACDMDTDNAVAARATAALEAAIDEARAAGVTPTPQAGGGG
jgi:hypothetical protein